MKKYLFILAFFMAAHMSDAQVTDTAAYLNNNIAANKTLFINQPFSILLDSLKVNPISFIGHVSQRNKKSEHSTTFYFRGGLENRIYMIIKWDTPIIKTSSHEQVEESSNWQFTSQIENLYSSKIIKDIIIKGPGI